MLRGPAFEAAPPRSLRGRRRGNRKREGRQRGSSYSLRKRVWMSMHVRLQGILLQRYEAMNSEVDLQVAEATTGENQKSYRRDGTSSRERSWDSGGRGSSPPCALGAAREACTQAVRCLWPIVAGGKHIRTTLPMSLVLRGSGRTQRGAERCPSSLAHRCRCRRSG